MPSQTGGAPTDSSTHAVLEQLVAQRDSNPAANLSLLSELTKRAGQESNKELEAAAQDLARRILTGDYSLGTLRGDFEQLQRLAQKTAPASTPSLGDDAELIGDFLLESREHLTSVEQNILELESNPGKTEAIHATFRSFHTIKGLAGFLGLGAIQAVAHETETLLDMVRSGSLAINPRLIDVILRSSDYLKTALRRLEENHVGFEESAPAGLLEAISTAAETSLKGDAPAVSAESKPDGANAPDESPDPSTSLAEQAKSSGSAAALKVDSDKIEHLIDMVGELVIAQSMVSQHPALRGLTDPALNRSLAHLARVTAEVQKTAMSMRMAPVSALFQKMSRVVRDVARKSGKQVKLAVSGDDAEMDRKILDGLAEPLMHMVRNAVDHGLEKPEERVKCGKEPTGTLRLRAERESGNIVVEIGDDGRGLNSEAIRKKAIERGLISPDSRLTPEETHRLIFEPGFSTAEKLTEFSGRGVGMDVVRRQVEYLRGRVEIRSVQGKGTTFTVRVPLTLATVDGLLIRVGEDRYVLPTFTVREIFRAGDRPVNTIGSRAEVVEFRKSTIPVVRLSQRLKTRSRTVAQAGVMIVIDSGSKQFCLAADEVIGKQEVVIKSLGSLFQNQQGIAGGAILGDGKVGLILDMDDMLETRYVAAAS